MSDTQNTDTLRSYTSLVDIFLANLCIIVAMVLLSRCRDIVQNFCNHAALLSAVLTWIFNGLYSIDPSFFKYCLIGIRTMGKKFNIPYTNIFYYLARLIYATVYVEKERRKSRTISTIADKARRVFGDAHRKLLHIPRVINDYNYHMGGVNIADQRRQNYKLHNQMRTLEGWFSLLIWLLDTTTSLHFAGEESLDFTITRAGYNDHVHPLLNNQLIPNPNSHTVLQPMSPSTSTPLTPPASMKVVICQTTLERSATVSGMPPKTKIKACLPGVDELTIFV
ncbi:hypothetical protein K457DRAFT_17179 [Linnemannia elongata AG-77]|uniref:Uncharacterized protein n=1 Tax=Linnemannia elongata AG-77 TaxID=1314771 RepID=A0A197K2Q7_9FUNG|nr:hypothetical protein K457DRAFT_17179 [Linnemannia elongata AG-77]